MSTPGLDVQMAIYGAGSPPTLPVSVEGWEAAAREILSDAAFEYIAGGAGAGDSMRENLAAFRRRHLRPRMLRDVAERDLSVSILGTPSTAPVLLAPVGVLSIAHPEAELAVARAGAEAGVPMILSTVSSFPLEQVAAAAPDAPRWFQVYPGKDPEVMRSMVRRAMAAGYSALVVTVDTPMLGWREWDLRNAYLPFLQAQGLANYFADPAFNALLPVPAAENPRAAVLEFLRIFVNPSFTWKDLAALCIQTTLPVLVKGIVHPSDAVQALDCGAAGVVVSNHGGRQVDGAVASLEALPEVVNALGGEIPVLFDSGIRRGADVLKALALGAEAVLLGRPYAYGLAVAGEPGVRAVLQQLIADLDLEMALCGRRSVNDVDGSLIE